MNNASGFLAVVAEVSWRTANNWRHVINQSNFLLQLRKRSAKILQGKKRRNAMLRLVNLRFYINVYSSYSNTLFAFHFKPFHLFLYTHTM